ncbi:MAG: hypothetical protein AB7Y46_12780 [Armatimonadota bacterium]
MDVPEANLGEINSLNQRGGRMLSVVDLIEAGSLDEQVAGYLLTAVAAGASFLCAAGPGGVGKTTLLACLLSFLPPGERICTVTDPWRLPPPPCPTCYLCHEIGSGHWYGYLWGEAAAQFLALHRQGRIAASLHADTVPEMQAQLLGEGVGADQADLAAVDLLAFMVRMGGMRRVSAVYEAVGGERLDFRRTVTWRPERDDFVLRPDRRLARLLGEDPRPLMEAATEFIARLVRDRVQHLEDVMAAVAGFYRDTR